MKDRVFCCELLEEDEDADFCETIEHYRWTFEDNNAYNDYDGTWNDFVSERNMLILNR